MIGTGACSIQFVPEIAPVVEPDDGVPAHRAVDLPNADRGSRGVQRALTGASRWPRSCRAAFAYLERESLALGLVHRPGCCGRLRVAASQASRAHAGRRPAAAATNSRPQLPIGCKRVLQSNDWYPALTEPNVEIVTSGVAEVAHERPCRLRGTSHEVDAIILGTGFNVFDPPIAHRIRGREALALRGLGRGIEAYLGAAVAGFPNFFLIVGPNTGLGHNSMVFMIESQLNYVLDCLRTMEARGAASVEVRPDVQAAYNEELHRLLQGTVWNAGGCASWYIDAQGRNRSIWPRQTWTFRRRTRRFDVESYRLKARTNGSGGGKDPISRAAPGADRSSAVQLTSR